MEISLHLEEVGMSCYRGISTLHNAALSTCVRLRFTVAPKATGELLNRTPTPKTARCNVTAKMVPLAVLKMVTATMVVRTPGGVLPVINNVTAPREMFVTLKAVDHTAVQRDTTAKTVSKVRLDIEQTLS